MKTTVGIFHVLAGHWHVAAEELGLETVWAHENLMKVGKFFRLNRPNIPFTGNYQMFQRMREKDAAMGIAAPDMIVGSPPCVGISTGNPTAGKDHAANIEIIRFAEVVDAVEPKAFIMEMVHNFKTSKKFRDLYNQYKDILNRKYNFISPVLQLSRYGSPTKRKRVFFIGFHKDKIEGLFHGAVPTRMRIPTCPPALNIIVTGRDVFEGLDNPTEDEAVAQKRTHKWNPLWKGPYSVLLKKGIDYFRLPENGPGRTFTAVGGVYIRHPDGHRAITKEEAKRLIGFPDDWVINAGYSTVIRACAWGVPIMSLVPIIKHVVEEMEH